MSGCLILRSGVEFLPFIKLWLLQNMWNVWIFHRWLLFCKKNTEKCWEIFWVGRYKIWDTAIGTTCRIFSILLLISIGGKLYLEISFSHGRPASNSWELYRPSLSTIFAPFLIFEHENVPMSNKLFRTRNAGNSIFHKVTLPTLADNASIPDILQQHSGLSRLTAIFVLP